MAFAKGAPISLTGLVGRPKLNGQNGSLGEFDTASGRWIVHLDSGESVKIKPQNICDLQDADTATKVAPVAEAYVPQRGERVSLFGLVGRPEINQQSGVLEIFDEASKRWVVHLDSGETVKIKAANLNQASPNAAAESHSAWVYHTRARGALKPSDLKMIYIPMPQQLIDGEVLLQTLYLSIDAGAHPRMRNQWTWSEGATLQDAMLVCFRLIARVIESRNPDWNVGDVVSTSGHARRFFKINPNMSGAWRISLLPGLSSVRDHLHLLGASTGLTAWLAIKNYGVPKGGKVVYISAAAGAVGLVAGQIYAIHGCSVIGSAGSDAKVELIKQYGYKDGFNYKTEALKDGLARLAPDGVDIFFDNVGGRTFEQTLSHMNTGGQILKCGSVSQYDVDERYSTDASLVEAKSLRLDNFAGSGVGQWSNQFQEGTAQLHKWVVEGKLKMEETIFPWEQYGEAYLALMKGGNIGKAIVKCPQPEGFEEL